MPTNSWDTPFLSGLMGAQYRLEATGSCRLVNMLKSRHGRFRGFPLWLREAAQKLAICFGPG